MKFDVYDFPLVVMFKAMVINQRDSAFSRLDFEIAVYMLFLG